jgi:hypothetical protein
MENEKTLDVYLENVLSFDLNEALFSDEIINLNNFTYLSNNITLLNLLKENVLNSVSFFKLNII